MRNFGYGMAPPTKGAKRVSQPPDDVVARNYVLPKLKESSNYKTSSGSATASGVIITKG